MLNKKNVIFLGIVIGSLFCLGIVRITRYMGIHKGGAILGYPVYVSSVTATVLISDSTGELTDYIIKNYQGNDVWIDEDSTVTTSGTEEGYRFELGETVSPQGRISSTVYGLSSGTSGTTCYILKCMDR